MAAGNKLSVVEITSERKIESLYDALTEVINVRVRQNDADGKLTYAEAIGVLEMVKQHYILQSWDLIDD